jgi:type II secretion system protein G
MWGGVATAHTIRAVQDFLSISNALKTFEIHSGRYPTAEEGLRALVERPANWPMEKPWQQIMLKIPSDPWGNPYFYVASPSSGEGFGLYSMGRDGVSSSKGNDPDDWNTWSEEHQEEYRIRDSFSNRLAKSPWLFGLAVTALILAMAVMIRDRQSKIAKAQD